MSILDYIVCTIRAASSVPDAPTNAVATAGNAQASVSFSPPVNGGSSPITSYTVTSNPGSIQATGASSPIVVTGLTNGTTYTFTVTATNAVGTSIPSSPSNAVIPSGSGLGMYAPPVSSPAAGAANPAYIPTTDYYGGNRTSVSDKTIGAVIAGSVGTMAPILSPVGLSYQVGADPSNNGWLAVLQGGGGFTTTIAPTSATAFANAINGIGVGGTVLLSSGNYTWTGGATITASGNAANWIVVKPAPGANVTITGPGIGTIASIGPRAVSLHGCSYISIEGTNGGGSLTFTNFGSGISTDFPVGGQVSYVRVKGVTITQMGAQGIGFWINSGFTPSNIEVSYNNISYTSQAWNNGTQTSGWAQGLTFMVNYGTAAYNNISYTNGEAIGTQPGSNVWIVGNNCFNSNAVGIYGDRLSYGLIEANLVYNNVVDDGVGNVNHNFWASVVHSRYQVGVFLASESAPSVANVVIRNNVTLNMGRGTGWGNYGYGNMTNCSWINNTNIASVVGTVKDGGGQTITSHFNMEFDAPASGSHSGVVIENNISDWLIGGSGNIVGTTTGLTSDYNLWYGLTAGAISGAHDVNGQNPQLRLS